MIKNNKKKKVIEEINNFYQIYKESKEGSKYIDKSLIVEQKH